MDNQYRGKRMKELEERRTERAAERDRLFQQELEIARKMRRLIRQELEDEEELEALSTPLLTDSGAVTGVHSETNREIKEKKLSLANLRAQLAQELQSESENAEIQTLYESTGSRPSIPVVLEVVTEDTEVNPTNPSVTTEPNASSMQFYHWLSSTSTSAVVPSAGMSSSEDQMNDGDTPIPSDQGLTGVDAETQTFVYADAITQTSFTLSGDSDISLNSDSNQSVLPLVDNELSEGTDDHNSSPKILHLSSPVAGGSAETEAHLNVCPPVRRPITMTIRRGPGTEFKVSNIGTQTSSEED